MPITPQVSTPPRPWVEKQEPKTDSILSSRIMQDSSRHRLDMAAWQGMEQGWRGRGVRGRLGWRMYSAQVGQYAEVTEAQT
jgi:hypothetical protein